MPLYPEPLLGDYSSDSSYQPRLSTLPPDLRGPTGLEFPTPRGMATELVNTVQADGGYWNLPMLVPGQTGIDALLAGQRPSPQQIGIALQWARRNGVTPHPTLDAALSAERQRHQRLNAFYGLGLNR